LDIRKLIGSYENRIHIGLETKRGVGRRIEKVDRILEAKACFIIHLIR
jgi:hypothetical protein